MRDRIEYFLYVVIGMIVRSMRWERVERFGYLLAAFAYRVIPIRVNLMRDNLSRAFPEKSQEEIESLSRAAYANVVISLLEIFWLPRFTAKKMNEIITMPGVNIIDERLKEGRGLIMLGGHFGNWELTALAVGLLGGHPLTIIVQRQRNPFVDAFMSRSRVLFGSRLVEMERSPRELFGALRNNLVVAMLADQSGPQEGAFVDFFGRPAATHRGPAVFSVRTGAPIVMAFSIRLGGGRYRIECEEVDTQTLTGTEEEKVEELTRRHVAMLEKYIRKYPDHWLWAHKRWKHSPPNASLKKKAVHETSS